MSSLSKKRACDLVAGDRVSLPLQLMCTDAYIKHCRPIPTSSGKTFMVMELETDTGPWKGAKAEFGFPGNEKLDYYNPPSGIFHWIKNVWCAMFFPEEPAFSRIDVLPPKSLSFPALL